MELYDKMKLQENLFQYCRGIDRMDAEQIRSTYWPESTDDHGFFHGPGAEWPEAGVEWKDNLYNCNHHVTNVLIELKGTQAQRESMFMVCSNMKNPEITYFLGGRYRDLCEKREGAWKILRRVCVWDWFEHYPTSGGWELTTFPTMSNWGAFHPHDPIYGDWTKSEHTMFPRPGDQLIAHHLNAKATANNGKN